MTYYNCQYDILGVRCKSIKYEKKYWVLWNHYSYNFHNNLSVSIGFKLHWCFVTTCFGSLVLRPFFLLVNELFTIYCSDFFIFYSSFQCYFYCIYEECHFCYFQYSLCSAWICPCVCDKYCESSKYFAYKNEKEIVELLAKINID